MINLMYHCVYRNNPDETGFTKNGADQYKLSVKDFEKQVRLICKYFTSHNINVSEKVCFTFDDGGRSFYDEIAPVLERYGLKGIFFITTKYIDTPNFLTRQQIRELYDRGHIIGSHSHTHANLAKLSVDACKEEWRNSIEILKSIIGEDITYASIPGGYCTQKVVFAAFDNGITRLYTSETTDRIKFFGNSHLFGRYVVHRNTPTKSVLKIISRSSYRLRLRLSWMVLNYIKFFLGDYYSPIKSKIRKYLS